GSMGRVGQVLGGEQALKAVAAMPGAVAPRAERIDLAEEPIAPAPDVAPAPVPSAPEKPVKAEPDAEAPDPREEQPVFVDDLMEDTGEVHPFKPPIPDDPGLDPDEEPEATPAKGLRLF